MSAYIPSLKKLFKANKKKEAKELLGQLASQPDGDKQEVVQLLAIAHDKTAFELLLFLTSKDNQVEEIHERLIQLAIDRAHLSFQFVLILFQNAGNEIIHQSIPLLRHILSSSTDTELLAEIITWSGKIRLESLAEELAEFIFYDDKRLKEESVKALERIGTTHACELLVKASETEKCDQNILDAIQVLSGQAKAQKEEKEPEPEKTSPEPPEPEQSKPTTRPAAKTKKSEPEELTFDDHLEKLVSTDLYERFNAFASFAHDSSKIAAELPGLMECGHHDLAISLLRLTERTIPVSAINDLFNIIDQKKIDNTIKFAAYSALNAYPSLKSAASVVKGLSEAALFVRLAAIQVLDNNLSDFISAEIKSQIESGTKKGEALAENILDAQASNIIDSLMGSDAFNYIASNYLSRNAPQPVLDTFIKILEQRKLKSTARKYKDLREEKLEQDKKLFIVISTSKAALQTYSKLICACGFLPNIYQNPQDAFEAFLAEKPAAIVCDLFLNDMTGLDIAQEVRELYPVDEVPFIISTFQKTLDKELLASEMERSGVNAICDFPAKTSQIKSWVK